MSDDDLTLASRETTADLDHELWCRIGEIGTGLAKGTYADDHCGSLAEAEGYHIDDHIEAYEIARECLQNLRRCCALLMGGVL